MNVAKVETELRQKYPGVVIKENKDDTGEVTEIIGEIDRSIIGSDRAVAVAVVDASPEHFHETTAEEYEVLKGKLTVYLNGQPHYLNESQKLAIELGTRHRAEGNETWIYCFSEPAWTAEDYHLV